jgi:predicted nucleic-acid-binding Zn-ribbon protein
MIEEPLPNFQCPKCGNMSVVQKQQRTAVESFMLGLRKEITTSYTLVCLKCKWEYQNGETLNSTD